MSQFTFDADPMMDGNNANNSDDAMFMMDLEDMLQDDLGQQVDKVGHPQMLTRTVTPETHYRKTSDALMLALQQGQPVAVNGQEQLITPRMASCMAMDLDLPDRGVTPGLNSKPNQNTTTAQGQTQGHYTQPKANISLTGPTADLLKLKTPVIPEGRPLVPQVTLMDTLPTPTLPAPSPAFMQSQQRQGSTSTPAMSFDQMVAASRAATASLAPTFAAPQDDHKRKRPHRRAATEGSFDFLYRQQHMEQETTIQQKVATREPLLGPMEPPKQDPLNVMAHSFVKQEQLRLVNGGSPPPPPPPLPPMEQAPSFAFEAPVAAPAPTPFAPGNSFMAASASAPSPFTAGAPANVPNPFMATAAPAPSVTMLQNQRQPEEQQSIIALEGIDDHDCIQASATDETLYLDEFNQGNTPTDELSLSEEGEPQAQPSRLSQFLDTLQAQADLQTQHLMDEQHQQRNSINVPPRQYHHQQEYSNNNRFDHYADYHQQQPPPTRQKKQHRRVVSDMGPSIFAGHQFEFDMSDMIEDRALWMKR